MKLPVTIEIEEALCKRFKGTAERYATEIPVSYIHGVVLKSGIVDFVTARHNYINDTPVINCFEIKISFADMKSVHGHTLVGDDNYYVLTKELYNEIIKKEPNLIHGDMGILIYEKGHLREIRNSQPRYFMKKLSIESRFRILDQMLMRWQNGRNIEIPSELGKQL